MTAVAPTLAYVPPLAVVRRPRPAPRPRTAVPAGRAGRPRRAVYWRRRVLVVVLALATLPLLADRAAGVFGGGGAPVHELRTTHYVVAPGDTLWTIARHLEPARDPREVVDALVAARHTTLVVPGEVIDWAGM